MFGKYGKYRRGERACVCERGSVLKETSTVKEFKVLGRGTKD